MKISFSILLVLLSWAPIVSAQKEIRAVVSVYHLHNSIGGYTEEYSLTIFVREKKMFASLSFLERGPFDPFATPKSVTKTMELSQEEAERIDRYFAISLGLQDEIRERESRGGLNRDTCTIRLLTFNGSESREVEFYHLFGIEYLGNEILTPVQLKELILEQGK